MPTHFISQEEHNGDLVKLESANTRDEKGSTHVVATSNSVVHNGASISSLSQREGLGGSTDSQMIPMRQNVVRSMRAASIQNNKLDLNARSSKVSMQGNSMMNNSIKESSMKASSIQGSTQGGNQTTHQRESTSVPVYASSKAQTVNMRKQ